MAWIYLAESGESAKPWLPGFELSPIVKESDTLKPSCFQEWSAEKSKQHQSGMTSQPSVEQCSRGLTSSVEDSPVRIYQSLDLEQAWRESEAAYFLKSYGLHASYNRDLCSWRMSQEFLLGIHLEQLEERWPRQVMIVDGECYRLRMWEPGTKEKDGSAWPTPRKVDGHKNDCPGERRRHSPCLETAVKMRFGIPLEKKLHLHPHFPEWLMGYHFGVTGSSALATEWFHSKSKKRLKD